MACGSENDAHVFDDETVFQREREKSSDLTQGIIDSVNERSEFWKGAVLDRSTRAEGILFYSFIYFGPTDIENSFPPQPMFFFFFSQTPPTLKTRTELDEIPRHHFLPSLAKKKKQTQKNLQHGQKQRRRLCELCFATTTVA